MKDSIKRKLLSLSALAKRGEPGEAQNAQEAFDALAAKHGITPSELSEILGEEVEKEITIKDDHEDTILNQICAMVGAEMFRYVRASGKKRFVRILHGTAARVAQAVYLFEIHRKALEKALHMAVVAYIHANNIFPPSSGKEQERKPLTDEQRDMLRMAKTMRPTEIPAAALTDGERPEN